VGEEGLGDLRGVKHLFARGASLSEAAAFVALDGTGLRRVVHRAIGARRLRVTVSGAGGHSWADWGMPNPVQALGNAIAELGRIRPEDRRRATLTVARISGGTSVNSIPAEGWMELDLRSEDEAALRAMESEVRRVVEASVRVENERRRPGTAPHGVTLECMGLRPSGSVAEDSPVVRAALAATRLLGVQPELAASSTDANVPISLGIPAVTLGAGGESGGIHTLDEWYADRDAARGLERALLTVLALAGCVREGR
jgi:acetylornithine deacetylase/succinyl-diaminopimelate desuccinylase-like protein